MNIISFSWTSKAFIANRKTETRRQWTEQYAKRFKIGDICKAYDKQPRYRGKQIGLLQIKNLYYQHIRDMPDSSFEAEGFAYMKEYNIQIWDLDAETAFNQWRKQNEWYLVIEFKKLEWKTI